MATSFEITLRSVCEQVKEHRARRQHPKQPFPVEIWQELAQLAKVYGISKVAKQAEMDATTLASHVRKLQAETPDTPDFVECLVAGVPAAFETTIEVESRVGERLRIQASNLRTSDLTLLLREFLAR